MSKNNPDVSEFDPLKNREFTEAEKQEQGLFNKPTPPQAGDAVLIASGSSLTTPTSSLNALQGGIAGDGQTLDPITEAIRKEILEKQREQIRLYLSTTHPELEEQTKDDEEFKKFLAQLNAQQRGFIDDTLKNEKVKAELERIELAGYKNIHSTFSAEKYQGGFRPMNWDGPTQDDVRSQVVKNGVDDPICTLTETMHNTAPMTVYKQDGSAVTVNSYRTVDFPVKLGDDKTGTMHLSMVALDENGQRPSVDQAVYFTAHYEATPAPDGQPKLKEVSSPQPLKFMGDGKDAVGYIEHGGKIYTLPVTRGKYQEMMQEVAINKGQSVDISQTVTAEDLIKNQEQTVTPPQQQLNSELEAKQVKEPIPQEQTIFSESQKIQQPQQSQTTEQKPLFNATKALANSMQDLFNYVNAGLTKETDNDKKIDLIKNAAEAILQKDGFAEKQANINTLSDNVLTEDLNGNATIQGISAILETINNDTNLVESEKVNLLKGISATVLNADNLEKDHRQKILENVIDSVLGLKDKASRDSAFNGIVDNIIGSKLNWEVLTKIDDKVNASGLSDEEKLKLRDSILDKSVKANILDPEQQIQMQQNLDKIIAEQKKKDVIKDVQGIVANPAFNTLSKAEAVKKITTDVLDSPAKTEIKGEIIEGVSKAVANSRFLDTKGKADVVKGIGEAIATNNNISPTEKVTTIESVEKGIASSSANLEDKKQMTTRLVDGNKPGLYGAVQGVADAAKGVFDHVESAFKQSKEFVVSEEEKIVNETKDILNNIDSYVKSLRNSLSSRSSKTVEEKSTDSEQQINKLVENYKAIDEKYKPQYEQRQGSYDTVKESQEKNTFIENLKLDDNDKIKLFEKLIQHEGDNKRKGSVENMNVLTNKKTDLENKIASPGKSSGEVYAAQTAPRKDTGRTP